MTHLWIDVEDLFVYARAFRRPSGIQRTVFELCQALVALDEARIGLLRHAGSDRFTPVAWSELAGLFTSMAAPPVALAGPPTLWQLQRAAFRGMAEIGRSLLPTSPAAERSAAPSFAPGDVLLVAGAGWDDPSHTRRLLANQRRHGLRLALLAYDIIPIRRPEWSDRQTAARFRRWFETLLTEASDLLAISEATAADVAALRTARGLPFLPAQVIRLGDGFATGTATPTGIDGPYALFVSTMEIRKNHSLLVEAWRVLLGRLGPAQVPKLVFAGRQGPMVADLLASLHASRLLDGHIILRPHASDGELAALYRGCQFTLFPSLYEGWGLPVAESLCFGKPCFAANATSIPEVGAALVRHFDPMDLTATVQAIEAVLQAPDDLARWEAEIHATFHPKSWTSTAESIRTALDRQD